MSMLMSNTLKSVFDTALAIPIATPGLRGLTFGSTYLLSRDLKGAKISSYVSLLSNRQTFSRLLSMLEGIDDAVDFAKPEEIIASDFSHDDQGACRLLHDARFVPAEYISCLKDLATQSLISFENSLGYSNLFCHMIRDRAEVQLSLRGDKDAAVRHQMVEDNIAFAGAFGCFIFGLLKPLDKKQAFLYGENAHAMLADAYPDIYAMNAAAQYLDDLRDVMIDLEEEIKSGTISPNVILGHALDGADRYDELYDFHETYGSSASIPVNAVPKKLTEAIAESFDEYVERLAPIKSTLSKNILESFWRNTLKEGFKTSLHPAVMKKRSIEESRYSNFTWSG